jgi:hypothetical protein
LQAQLKDIQAQLALAQDKYKEADQKINNLLDAQDLNEGLRTALKKENIKLKEQMADIEKSKQKIKADFDDSVTKLSQYQKLLKVSQDKNKELETPVAGLADEKQIAPEVVLPGHGGKDKVELDKIVVNPQNGTKGHILSFDTDADFVIFNLGLKQGVKPDDVLSVYRENEYLGDVKATHVLDEMSAADSIPPFSIKEVRKNDTVVLKP